MIEKLMTAQEVAEMLRLTPQHVRTLARLGRLPSIRFNARTVRFRQSAIEEYLERRSMGGDT